MFAKIKVYIYTFFTFLFMVLFALLKLEKSKNKKLKKDVKNLESEAIKNKFDSKIRNFEAINKVKREDIDERLSDGLNNDIKSDTIYKL